LAAGEVAAAERLVADFAGASPRQAAAAVTGRALLATAGGESEAGLAGFEEAEARWREHGVVVEQALAALGAARCLRALGRPDDASCEIRLMIPGSTKYSEVSYAWIRRRRSRMRSEYLNCTTTHHSPSSVKLTWAIAP